MFPFGYTRYRLRSHTEFQETNTGFVYLMLCNAYARKLADEEIRRYMM